MADNLNIKNPSVTEGVLDLRTDASGNIVSISGHSIAGGAGGGNVYFGDDEYIQFKTGTTNTFTLTDGVKDVIEHIPQTVETEVNRISYTKDSIDDKLDDKQDKLIFEYDEDNKVSAINGSALAGQGGTTYTPGQYINIDSNNEISVTGVVAADEYATYSGDWNDVSNSYKTNSGSFLTSEALTNYYPKTQTSSDSELAEAFGSILKYDVTAAAGIQVITATDAGVKTYGISMTAQPVVTDTRLSGYNGIAAEPDGNVSGLWDVGLTQDMLNKINGKLDSTAAAQTYLEKSTYTNASGKWENTYNVVNQYSAAGTWLTEHQSLTNYYTKDETSGASEIENALTGKQDKLTFAGESNTITSINNSAVGGGTSFTGVTTAGSISGDGLTNPLGLVTSAEQALSAVANKLEPPPHNTQQSTNYIWSDPLGQGIPGWIDANNWLDAALENTEFLHAEDLRWYISPENGVSGKWDNEEEVLKLGIDITNMAANKQYAFTTTGWAEVQAGTSFTGVVTGVGLSGTGLSNSPLGIDTTAAINFTNGSAKSAISAESALSSRYAKQLQDASKIIQISDVTALQNWASSNSSTWDSVTAKLGTAQYALDSATFVTSSSNTITGTKQYALTTTGWSDIGLSNYLPLSGGTVSGDVIVSSRGTCLLTVGTEATLMGQSRVVNMGDTTARGTNWLGVSQSNQGFLKYVNGGDVGALNGTSIQINFAPDGANSYGNITVNSQDNVSKVVHVPTASYNSMSSFDNTNGPNYMLRKTASGFDIGAAVVNVTSLPQQIEANAYYFVYDV